MDYQNLLPHQAQPINRIPAGQLPTELAELTEEVMTANAVNDSNVLPSGCLPFYCSYDGDDAE